MSETFQNTANNHHLLFPRALHEAMGPTKLLRNNMGMQALIDVDSHNEIHRELNIVPVLDFHNASRVVSGMRKRRPLNPQDPLQSIDTYMFLVQEATMHPRNRELDVELGDLVIRAMELQRPIVAQGISRKTIIDLGHFAHLKNIPLDGAA